MMLPTVFKRCQLAAIALAVAAGATFTAATARADWEKTDTTVAWKANGKVLWRFSFDPTKGKSFFDPVSAGGPAFTNFKPADHPWHYGLWFSWKYLNPPGTEHVNFWEEDRTTGNAQGKTAWKPPTIETQPDGSAVIKMDVTYTSAKGEVDMTESRQIVLSAPAPDNSYNMDWTMHFTAGKNGTVLDRTPMPGEPGGQVNGGYAGLSIRMAGLPLMMKVVTPAGPITDFPGNRARPNSPSVGCNFVDATGANQGGVAFYSDPANISNPTPPWYIINDNVQVPPGAAAPEGFRFICSCILGPKILTLKPKEKMDLHYRISMSPKAWTEATLKAGQEAFTKK